MRLFSSTPSPFGRKVKITAHITGLYDHFDVIDVDSADLVATRNSSNPLIKIPALQPESG